MAIQFTAEQISDTVNEFVAENLEFDTFYDDNAGFQEWKKEGQNVIAFCTSRAAAYKKLTKFMNLAIDGQWEPRR